jgi:hypothetical protein
VLGLEPLGEDATKAHDGIVRNVLGSGTKISLSFVSHRPNRQEYLIERTIPNPPLLRDQSGNLLNFSALEILPRIEVYGQHELSELTKSPEKITRLLDRFVEADPALSRRKSDVRRQVQQSRGKILQGMEEITQIEERLANLPALEDTLKRYKDAGVEQRLRDQSLLVREEQVLKTAAGRLDPLRAFMADMGNRFQLMLPFCLQRVFPDSRGRKYWRNSPKSSKASTLV